MTPLKESSEYLENNLMVRRERQRFAATVLNLIMDDIFPQKNNLIIKKMDDLIIKDRGETPLILAFRYKGKIYQHSSMHIPAVVHSRVNFPELRDELRSEMDSLLSFIAQADKDNKAIYSFISSVQNKSNYPPDWLKLVTGTSLESLMSKNIIQASIYFGKTGLSIGFLEGQQTEIPDEEVKPFQDKLKHFFDLISMKLSLNALIG